MELYYTYANDQMHFLRSAKNKPNGDSDFIKAIALLMTSIKEIIGEKVKKTKIHKTI